MEILEQEKIFNGGGFKNPSGKTVAFVNRPDKQKKSHVFTTRRNPTKDTVKRHTKCEKKTAFTRPRQVSMRHSRVQCMNMPLPQHEHTSNR